MKYGRFGVREKRGEMRLEGGPVCLVQIIGIVKQRSSQYHIDPLFSLTDRRRK
jgi:hypothetical protein